MILKHTLMRPAAAEVRMMLQRIKKDNMERGRHLVANNPSPSQRMVSADETARDIPNSSSMETPNSWMPLPRSKSLVSTNLEQMGSFTSMPKIAPAPNSDDRDLAYPEEPEDLETTLARCSEHLAGLPEPIERSWSQPLQSKSNEDQNADFQGGEKIRVLQWNALSQALGTKNDNFVKCPPEALEWKTRRFRMLEEIVLHDADVICLQEVDHFRFFLKSLAPLGYHGHFFPKPDSPCLYLPENTGPDGCAIFYKTKKFDLTKVHNRVIEVWHVESNQVVMCTTLRSRTTGQEVCVATTHLKARNGALLSTLRNEQGKDLIEFMASESRSCGPAGSLPRAVICCGDFNAEPTEPVYQTMTENDLKLQSAYATIDGNEPKYTTWKIREDGEHIQTLDYMFYSEDQLQVNGLLDFPDGEAIGQNRLPSTAFASDHFSLVVDFTMKAHPKKRFCKE
ncbi:hypothetical protein TCAL_12530 [Tigriopus californicus]|uniref:Nocturnin n=1 Tax=Tigriopus californicus TaxID=6832 RepID=A0A553P7T8_TIGCA|nr:hypothetical protein TCAL_12530 [Tigriopus californicus]|eukprot:TCALIF_12530-PA protein Name:"Similar to Ccrn4l Nocturnin (Mus musculus)" AED:0.02 eAED:0.02 QI:909/1/1/1/1/1/5/766/451